MTGIVAGRSASGLGRGSVLSSPAVAQKIDALTGVRFVAALWAAIMHFRYGQFDELGRAFGGLVRSGPLAVPIFFILSGFILAYTYRGWFADHLEGMKYGRFVGYRLARLHPLHLVTTLVIALVLVPLGIEPAGPADNTYTLALNMLLVQSWGFSPQLSWNMPAWSVSSEWLAYLVFPFLIAPLSRSPRWVLVGGVGLMVVVASLIPHPTPKLAYGLVTVSMLSLFIGGVCCQFLTNYARPGKIWDVVALLSGLGLLASATAASQSLTGAATTEYSGQYFYYGFSLVLIAALFLSRGFMVTALGNPIMVYLGEISFALYLTHIPTYWLIRFVAGAQLPLAVEIALALGVASVCYHFVEVPARKLGRRRVEDFVARTIRRPVSA